MNSDEPVAQAGWTRRRFATAIACVFAVHVVLLFWLSDRSKGVTHQSAATPVFHLRHVQPGQLLPLKEPTLFALPHDRDLAGTRRQRGPTPDLPGENWSEPPRWLTSSEDQFAGAFADFTRTNVAPRFETALRLEPRMAVPDLPPPVPVMPPSRVRLGGGLLQRRLLTQPELRSWRNTDLLTNSVVQVLVNAAGTIESAVLVYGSGWPEADQYALRTARSARFQSIEIGGPDRLKKPAPPSTSGAMIFEWQTLPSTNGPATATP